MVGAEENAGEGSGGRIYKVDNAITIGMQSHYLIERTTVAAMVNNEW